MIRTYINGFRIIRADTPHPATELDLGNGRALQMLGKGVEVERALRQHIERK